MRQWNCKSWWSYLIRERTERNLVAVCKKWSTMIDCPRGRSRTWWLHRRRRLVGRSMTKLSIVTLAIHLFKHQQRFYTI